MVWYIILAGLSILFKNWFALTVTGILLTLNLYEKRVRLPEKILKELSRVITKMPIPVAVMDKNHNYVSVSDSWITFFKFNFNPTGKNHFKVFPKLTDKCKSLHDAILDGGFVSENDYEFVHADGTKDVFDYSLVSLVLDGDVVGSVTSIIPKTELVKLKQKITDLEDDRKDWENKKHHSEVYQEALGLIDSIYQIDCQYPTLEEKLNLALEQIASLSVLSKDLGFACFVNDGSNNFELRATKSISDDLVQELNNKEFQKWLFWRAVTSLEADYKCCIPQVKQKRLKICDSFEQTTFYIVPLLRQTEVMGVLIVTKQTCEEQNYLETKLYSYLGRALGRLIKRHYLLQKLEIERKEKEEIMKKQKLLFASISHDIRGYTQNIVSLAEALTYSRNKNYNTEDESMEIAQNILNVSISLNELISDLLDLVKYQQKNLTIRNETFSITEMIESLVKQFKVKLKGDVHLDFYVDANIKPFYYGPKVRIQQVLSNLLSNAIKFTNRGSIKIQVNLLSSSDSDTIEFRVSDTGIGIPEGKINKIFDPFEQVEDSLSTHLGGTGLGLWICKKTINALGGELFVKSSLGVGTEFWFNVKLNPIEPVSVCEKNTEIFNQRIKILLADDDQISLKMMQKLLENEGHTVITATNGLEAVNLVLSNPDTALAILDFNMPMLNGVEAAKKIRESNKNIKLIALTGSISVDSSDPKPFDLILEKPVRRDVIIEKINLTLNN